MCVKWPCPFVPARWSLILRLIKAPSVATVAAVLIAVFAILTYSSLGKLLPAVKTLVLIGIYIKFSWGLVSVPGVNVTVAEVTSNIVTPSENFNVK